MLMWQVINIYVCEDTSLSSVYHGWIMISILDNEL